MEYVKNAMTSVLANPFGLAASITQLCVIFIGYPMQIVQLVTMQSAAGVSIGLYVLATLASVLWGLQAYKEKPNLFLLVTQVPAVLFMSAIIALCIHYR